ncbi:VIT domain-containing protein [Nannocystis sp.]|uniref:VIT domain-containing protein n=1 Tax=Nannocystis sp. TaxID=1962667 RepID=UPI0025E18565|nr:VIT domain-containing protein [Nannocystis sp.]
MGKLQIVQRRSGGPGARRPPLRDPARTAPPSSFGRQARAPAVTGPAPSERPFGHVSSYLHSPGGLGCRARGLHPDPQRPRRRGARRRPSIPAPSPARAAAELPPRQTLRPGDRDLGRAPDRSASVWRTGLRLVSLGRRAQWSRSRWTSPSCTSCSRTRTTARSGSLRDRHADGAAISRFTMKVRGAWQEGEVVERQAAQRAYQDFLHRKQDPALLENKAGNAPLARASPDPPA